MIFAKPNRVPLFVLDKLRHLFELLKERKKEFEELANGIKNHQLKITVLCLAQECNQYAHEIFSQLETMTGRVEDYSGACTEYEGPLFAADDDILQSCRVSEKNLIVAYRMVLNEPALNEHLRKLLRSQLNGLTYTFTQIKLLKLSLVRR